jgi:hypothetical protein
MKVVERIEDTSTWAVQKHLPRDLILDQEEEQM